MKPALKIAIVAGGYLLAFVFASAALALHAALTSESGARASGGMSAFGDLVLFIAIFGAFALVPTGAALFFLMSRKKMPDQLPGPTSSSVTPPADAAGAPSAAENH